MSFFRTLSTKPWVAERGYVSESHGFSSPTAKVFLLGTTPLPMWTQRVGGDDVERTIFHSINHALGIRWRGRPDPVHA